MCAAHFSFDVLGLFSFFFFWTCHIHLEQKFQSNAIKLPSSWDQFWKSDLCESILRLWYVTDLAKLMRAHPSLLCLHFPGSFVRGEDAQFLRLWNVGLCDITKGSVCSFAPRRPPRSRFFVFVAIFSEKTSASTGGKTYNRL